MVQTAAAMRKAAVSRVARNYSGAAFLLGLANHYPAAIVRRFTPSDPQSERLSHFPDKL